MQALIEARFEGLPGGAAAEGLEIMSSHVIFHVIYLALCHMFPAQKFMKTRWHLHTAVSLRLSGV